MDFVTKEEFDRAIAVVLKAVANGQVSVRESEHVTEEMEHLFFGGPQYERTGNAVNANRISFISPLQAARNKAHSLGLELKLQVQNSHKSQQTVSKLEKELEKLTSQIKALKE